MASVTLRKVWITNMATPSVSVSAYSAPDKSEDLEVVGSVRQYVGGRRRIITTPAVSTSLGVTLRLVSASDFALLQSWAGQLLMYRDNLGRKVFGTYFRVGESHAIDSGHEVRFTFESATHSEAV